MSERAVLTLAGMVALVGALIVLGWALDATLIPSGVAASPRVKANTGVCFVLAGLAVWLTFLGRGVWLGRMLAGVVVVIGGLSLIESALEVNLGIDQLLFRDSARLDPGRMAPNAALAFVLCGTALLPFAGKRGRLVAEALGVAAAVIGWLALIGFAGGLSQLAQVGGFVKMGLPAAICFLLLGSVVVLATPGGRLVAMLTSQGLAGPLVRRLLAAVIVVGPLASVLLRFGHASGLLDQGAVILLTLAVVAMSLLAVALGFAHSLDATDVSRLRAEQELRDSERRYRELAEGSIDAFIAMDHNGVITGWNPAAEALFGWPAEEAIGRTVAETIVPESLRSRHQAGLQRLAAGGPASVSGQRLELPALRRDGREVPIELYISVSAGRGGHRFHAFVHDISDRVDARRALESKHRQLDDAQTIAHVGSWSWEPATDSTEWSAEMYRIFDRDPAQGPAASEDFFAYLHPDDHDRIAARYAQAFGAGEGFGLDYRIVVGEGEVRFLHAIGQRERDGRYVGTVQDVSEYARSREALAGSKRRIEQILNMAGEGIVEFDADAVVTYANPVAKRIMGADGEEVAGRSAFEIAFVVGSDGERATPGESPLACVLRDGLTVETSQTLRRRDGTTVPIDVTVAGVPSIDGSVGGAVAVVRDATERIRTISKLAQQAAAVERSNVELQQFAFVASHDLQEPLRKISSYVQILEEDYSDRLDDDGRECIAFAVDGARRMRQLIEDLLAVARVRADNMKFNDYDTAELVSGILDDLAAPIADSGAVVELVGLPPVTGDAAQLRQIFQNLISNAIKYRGEAPPVVRIEAEATAEGWLFTVADNGMGFKQEYADKVFGMFQRLVGRSQAPGTGIGLAVVAKAVENHGGRVWAQSQPGVGSTFRFTLPSTGATADAATRSPASDAAAFAAAAGSSPDSVGVR